MDFLTYKKFYEQDRAEALAIVLQNNGIKFEITEDRESLDSMLIGDKHFNLYYFVKLKKEDFAKADSLLANESEKELEIVDKDHYLYEFTDEELFDILSKPDEWNAFDYQLSKKILIERGKEIDNETIDLLKKQRITELSKPEDSSKAWIYAGYLSAMLGGLIGIFMGIAIISATKTLPNGQKIYTYSVGHRKHGTRILIIGTIMFMISLFIRIATTEF